MEEEKDIHLVSSSLDFPPAQSILPHSSDVMHRLSVSESVSALTAATSSTPSPKSSQMVDIFNLPACT